MADYNTPFDGADQEEQELKGTVRILSWPDYEASLKEASEVSPDMPGIPSEEPTEPQQGQPPSPEQVEQPPAVELPTGGDQPFPEGFLPPADRGAYGQRTEEMFTTPTAYGKRSFAPDTSVKVDPEASIGEQVKQIAAVFMGAPEVTEADMEIQIREDVARLRVADRYLVEDPQTGEPVEMEFKSPPEDLQGRWMEISSTGGYAIRDGYNPETGKFGVRKKLDANGLPVLDENGQPIPEPIYTDTAVKKMRDHLTGDKEQERSAFESVLSTVGETLFGPSGSGDMGYIRDNLEEMGVTDPNAQAFMLRKMATEGGKHDALMHTSTEPLPFLANIPAYIWAGGKAAFTDATMSEALDSVYKVPTLSEWEAAGSIRPEVMEEVMSSRGLVDVGTAMAAAEAPFAAAWAAFRVARGRKAVQKSFAPYLNEKYGTSDVNEALKIAAEQGKNYTQVSREFLATLGDENARRRMSQNLNIGIMNLASRKGADNVVYKEILTGKQEEINTARTALNQLDISIGNARATGRVEELAALEKRRDIAQQALDNKQMEYDIAVAEPLMSKEISDLVRESRAAVIGATAAHVGAQQIFGAGADTLPYVDGLAAFAASTRRGIAAVENVPGTVARGTVAVAAPVVGALNAGLELMDIGARINLPNLSDMQAEQKARELIQVMGNVSPELVDTMLTGIMHTRKIGRDLMYLSNKYDVDVPENAVFNSFAMVSMIEELAASGGAVTNLANPSQGKFFEAVAERVSNTRTRATLINNVAELVTQIDEMRARAPVDPGSELAKFHDGLKQALASNKARLREDRAALDQFITANKQVMNLDMQLSVLDDNTAQINHTNFTDLLDAALANNGAELADGRTVTDILGDNFVGQMGDVTVAADKVVDDFLGMTNKLIRETTSYEVATAGVDTTSFILAKPAAVIQRKHRVEADALYTKLDETYKGATADVTDFYNEVLSGEARLLDEDAGEVSNFTLKMTGNNLVKGHSTRLKGFFGDAARRGIDQLSEAVPAVSTVSYELGIHRYNPLDQRRIIMEGIAGGDERFDVLAEAMGYPPAIRAADGEEMSPEMAAAAKERYDAIMPALAEDLPLLTSGKDWRNIGSAFGEVSATSRNPSTRRFYGEVGQKWDGIATNEANQFRMPDGTPAGDAFYADFKVANEFYRNEVVGRKAGGKVVGKDVGYRAEDLATAEDFNEAEFRKLFRDTDNPAEWVSVVLDNVAKASKTGKLTGDGPQDALYRTITSEFASKFGVYDPQSGTYKLIMDSAVEGDKHYIEGATQAAMALTNELRARLLRDTDRGREMLNPETLAKVEADFGPAGGWDKVRPMFDSVFEVPVYRRNADGSLSPMGQLVRQEDVFDVYNPLSYTQAGSKAQKVVNDASAAWKKDIQPEIDRSIEEHMKALEEEADFAADMFRSLTGASNANEAVSPAKVGEMLYNKAVSTDMLTEQMPRIKQQLRSLGYSEDAVDNAVGDLVSNHLLNASLEVRGRNVGTKNLSTGEHEVSDIKAVNPDKLYELLRVDDPEGAARLKSVIGEEAYSDLVRVANVANVLSPKEGGIGIRTYGMTLDSALGRGYNVVKGTVSLPYVLTEAMIRHAASRGASLLQASLKNPKIGEALIEMAETGRIPDYAVNPNLWMAAIREAALVTARTEFEEAGGEYYNPYSRTYVTGYREFLTESDIDALNYAGELLADEEGDTEKEALSSWEARLNMQGINPKLYETQAQQ